MIQGARITLKVMIPLLVFLVGAVWAMPTHFVSTAQVQVGDQFTYTVEWPNTLPPFELTPSINGVEKITESTIPNALGNTHQTVFQVFSVEDIRIPTQSIQDAAGTRMTMPAITISVQTTLPPTFNQFNDIAPIIQLKYLNPWVLVIVLGIVMVLLGVLWRLKKSKKHHLKYTPSPIPPIDVALKALSELQKINGNRQQIKEGYFKLSEVLCRFITDQVRVNIVDATTKEARYMLKKESKLPSNIQNDIVKLLQDMDYYKFNQQATISDMQFKTTIKQVQQLIRGLV